MDWLRSEDLKEEKNVTTPITSVAVSSTWVLEHYGLSPLAAGYPL